MSREPARRVVAFDKVAAHLPGCKFPAESERLDPRTGDTITECRSCGVVSLRKG